MCVEMQDPRPELVTDPQIAVGGAIQGFRIDVSAGQQTVGGCFVDDRKADPVVRIPEGDEVADLDRTRSTLVPS